MPYGADVVNGRDSHDGLNRTGSVHLTRDEAAAILAATYVAKAARDSRKIARALVAEGKPIRLAGRVVYPLPRATPARRPNGAYAVRKAAALAR